MRRLTDPRVSTAVVLSFVVVAGFVALGVAWRGAAALVAVPLQVPFVVSGGLAGLGLVGAGVGLLRIHLDRCEAAAERDALARAHAGVLQLLDELRE